MTEALGRILIVEDEGLVAMALEETLTAVGYEVLGPAPSTRKALDLIAAGEVDAALLDVNLGEERVDCVARALSEAGIPFVFSTGYSDTSALPPDFTDRKALKKPFRADELLNALHQLMEERQRTRADRLGTDNRQRSPLGL